MLYVMHCISCNMIDDDFEITSKLYSFKNSFCFDSYEEFKDDIIFTLTINLLGKIIKNRVLFVFL